MKSGPRRERHGEARYRRRRIRRPRRRLTERSNHFRGVIARAGGRSSVPDNVQWARLRFDPARQGAHTRSLCTESPAQSERCAGLAAVGSSLDLEKSRQLQSSQQCNLLMNFWAGSSIKNPDLSCVSPMPQFKRE
jgi:hypothetical protein